MILPADKGRATVVMDGLNYEERVLTMLNDETMYMKLKKDPTPGLERKINATLLRLHRMGQIHEQLYQHPFSHRDKHQESVGFQKFINLTFHSDQSYPLQHLQLIRCLNIFPPSLAYWLETSSAVRNSKDFVNFISLEKEFLVSFDVAFLFTNISTSLDVQVAHKHLENEEHFKERNLSTMDNIILLLKMCLDATFLLFEQQYYHQEKPWNLQFP